MLHNKTLVLASRQFAKEDRAKSWLYTLSTLFLLICALALTFTNIDSIWRITASVISGLLIVRMFVIYHDYLHHSILQQSVIAKIIFKTFGLYVLAPQSVWKRTHDHHHQNNSKLFKPNIGSYPILSTLQYKNCSAKEKFLYLFQRHPITIALGYIFTFLYGMCISPLFHGFKKHIDSFFALVLHFLIQLCILFFFGWEQWILFTIIPHTLSGALGSYLFYVQHNFPHVQLAGDEHWTYEGSAVESSSYLELGVIMTWVTANIGYHHVHHLNSRIPFYKLPEVMAHFEELQSPKKITLKPKHIIACLRLKLWDVEKQKLVPLNYH